MNLKHDANGETGASVRVGLLRFTGDVNIGQIIGWASAVVSLIILGVRSIDRLENTINSNSSATNSQIALVEQKMQRNEDISRVKLDALRAQLQMDEQELKNIRDRLSEIQRTRRTE